MKLNLTKTLIATSATFGLAMFAACEDTTTSTATNTGIATLKAGEDMPSCEESNSGEMLYVADSAAVYFCAEGEWNILNGKNGTNGKDGENGKDGSDGKDGENGKDGTDGKNGADGKDGTDGQNGEDGKNGENGKNGASCTAKAIDAGIEISCNDVVVDTLTSVKGLDGKSAYEIAAENGPVPETEEAWIASIKGTSCTAEPYTAPNISSKTGFKLTCGGKVMGVLWNGVDGQDQMCTMDFYDEKNYIVRLNCGSYDAYISGYVDYSSASEYPSSPSSAPSSYTPSSETSSSPSSEASSAPSSSPSSGASSAPSSTPSSSPSSGTSAGIEEYCANKTLESDQICDPRDGNVYKTVKIEELTWMAENLSYASAYSTKDSDVPGRHYKGANLSDELCPEGWRLPVETDFKTLISIALKQANNDTLAASLLLRSTTGWASGYNGSDFYGLNIKPAGNSNGGSLWSKTFFVGFWGSTPGTKVNGNSTFVRLVINSSTATEYLKIDFENSSMYHSVRCVKD